MKTGTPGLAAFACSCDAGLPQSRK